MLSRVLVVLVLFYSASSWSNEYSYQADVKGMVCAFCAFCAYNVSKNIRALPGVDANSVDVDLKGGHVTFNAEHSVNEDQLAAVLLNRVLH